MSRYPEGSVAFLPSTSTFLRSSSFPSHSISTLFSPTPADANEEEEGRKGKKGTAAAARKETFSRSLEGGRDFFLVSLRGEEELAPFL